MCTIHSHIACVHLPRWIIWGDERVKTNTASSSWVHIRSYRNTRNHFDYDGPCISRPTRLFVLVSCLILSICILMGFFVRFSFFSLAGGVSGPIIIIYYHNFGIHCAPTVLLGNESKPSIPTPSHPSPSFSIFIQLWGERQLDVANKSMERTRKWWFGMQRYRAFRKSTSISKHQSIIRTVCGI